MQTKSRAEMAADLLGSLSADSATGMRLGTKEELRAQAGVSVGTFNEALRLAQTRGIVEVRPGPGGGIFAASQSGMVRLANVVLALDTDASAVQQAIRMRDALDPLLMEDAIENARPADVARLRGIADEIEHIEQNDGGFATTKAIWKLHAAIADISPNKMIGGIYASLLDLIEKHAVGAVGVAPNGPVHRVQDRVRLHRDMVEAIARRDHEWAAELMIEHEMSARKAK